MIALYDSVHMHRFRCMRKQFKVGLDVRTSYLGGFKGGGAEGIE